MKLMFFPVTIIDELPHLLLNYDFSRKCDRYFLSPYNVDISSHGSQKTVCQVISSSNFLCGLLNINRETLLTETNVIKSNVKHSDESETNENKEKSNEESSSCEQTSIDDNLLKMIEEKLDFKHRCVFYSTGPTSEMCVCALDFDHNSSVECNAIGYSTIDTNENHGKNSSSNNKIRARSRTQIHQWICIRDIIEGLVTTNHVLKSKTICEILNKIDVWLKQRNQKQTPSTEEIDKKMFKAKARQLVWDLMELKNEVRFPRPSHGRIPNFRYCEVAAENLIEMSIFRRARVIKVNPSLAQEAVCYWALACNKTLLVPSPALETVFFYKLDPKLIRRHQYEWAATKSGAAELGIPLSLSDLKQIHVDLVVVASVVVNPISGARIGKGKGYDDLEYGILSQIGSVDKKTIVLTTCHESQLINDLPTNIMEEHDLPVDIIVTPKRYIYTKRSFKRPERVFWDKIDSEMISNIPVLNQLKQFENDTEKKD